jgi:hypothetical protein
VDYSVRPSVCSRNHVCLPVRLFSQACLLPLRLLDDAAARALGTLRSRRLYADVADEVVRCLEGAAATLAHQARGINLPYKDRMSCSARQIGPTVSYSFEPSPATAIGPLGLGDQPVLPLCCFCEAVACRRGATNPASCARSTAQRAVVLEEAQGEVLTRACPPPPGRQVYQHYKVLAMERCGGGALDHDASVPRRGRAERYEALLRWGALRTLGREVRIAALLAQAIEPLLSSDAAAIVAGFEVRTGTRTDRPPDRQLCSRGAVCTQMHGMKNTVDVFLFLL